MNLTPDRWVILKHSEGQHTVFSGWYGGYLNGDSWRRSTPIREAHMTPDGVWHTKGNSTTYNLHVESYGMSAYMASIIGEAAAYGTTVLTEDEANEYLEELSK